MTRGWLAQRERSNAAAIRFLVWGTLALGRGFGRALLVPITLYFLAFSIKARRASRNYLRRALGRNPRLRDLFLHYYSFAVVSLDRVFFLDGREDLFELEITGEEVLRDVLESGAGCVLLGAHVGSFEAPRMLGKSRGLRISMAMFQENARKLNAVISAVNPELANVVIELGRHDSMLRVHERVASGEWVGILADRAIYKTGEVRVQFFGGQASFPTAPFRVAAMLGRPMVMMMALYHGGNRYELCFERLVDAPRLDRARRDEQLREWIQRYAERLEHHLRRAPYNWFNFYDFWSNAGPGR
jgi:predicted LPLAT superfamily acyltransferase